MEVISVEESKCEIVEVVGVEGGNSLYKRYSNNSWQVLMGESWEPVYVYDKCNELEQAYQKFILLKKGQNVN